MWMVGGYNDSSHHHNHHHQAVNLDGRKLRPLIPRPPLILSSANCASSSATTHSCNFGLYTSSDLFSLNHHPGVGSEQGIREKNINKEDNGGTNQAVVNTSRWNPTQEQLRTLEDLYRRGTRTPSTEQIQRITAELRRYGKIEGKNVFYWFQNHKARERQKRRRELEILSHHQPHEPVIASKERGPANGKHGYETEQTRRPYSIIAEECGATSMQRAAAATKAGRRAAAVSDDRHNTINTSTTVTTASACLFQLDDERNATWHTLSPSSSPSVVTCVRTSSPPTHKTRRFIGSLKHPATNTISLGGEEEGGGEDSPTLQLFPLRSQQEEDDEDKSTEKDVHFFEFLPPKT